jgi:hypothetical protein
MAQITGKTVYDKKDSSLKMTITNLYEDRSVMLMSKIKKNREIEVKGAFSGQTWTYINGDKLFEIRLYFYDENQNEIKDVHLRISDKKLQENPIAPSDSVCYAIFRLDPEDNMPRKIRIWTSISYSTVDGDIFGGRYECTEDVYLSSLYQ